MAERIKKSLKTILGVAIIGGGFFGIAYGIEAYSKIFQVAITLEKKSDIKPDEPVVINFSESIMANSLTSGGISIFPAVPLNIEWATGNKKIIIYPEVAWRPETNYAITFLEGRSAMFTKIKQTEVYFSTVKYPQIVSFYPENEAQDVIIDIEDPIKIDFKESVSDFSIKFSITPDNQLSYEIDKEQNSIKVIPAGGMKRGEKYEMKVYAAYIGDNKDKKTGHKYSEYAEIYSSSFETLPPLPENWEKDSTLRIQQAKKFTRARIVSGKYIDINLAAQIMSIFENGEIVDSFLVSSGKKGMDTPKGEYKIKNKATRVWSKNYGLYMPFWMAVAADGKFGIHELPEWPGGYKEGANHLGIPVSHGCIRLGVGPAKTVFDWTEIGTPVAIY